MGTWKNEYHARQLQNSFRQHEPSGLRSASFRHEMEFCRQWLSTDRPNVPGTGVSVQQPQVFSKTIANYFPPMSTVNGQTTTFAYDEANQLVSKTLPDGTTVTFGYDAAGRLVREGDRHYAYGWLDKVLAVTGADGETLAAYAYGLDGQLASATVGGATEEFLWDGLALVRRGATGYLNEPHANGGSPLLSSGGAILFNDLLGSTLGTLGGNGEYRAVSLTAFGDTEDAGAFFTGKPKVDGLGYAFLLRSYRPDHGKWLTADPLGYPDGWNQMAYCNNQCYQFFDCLGACVVNCVDMYNNLNVQNITGAEQLVVMESGTNGHGAGFSVSRNIAVYRPNSATPYIVIIPIGISFGSILPRSADVNQGTVVKYTPHSISYSDSMIENPFYEMVAGHERGHAQAFLHVMVSQISSILTSREGIDNILDEAIVKSICNDVIDEVWETYKLQSLAYANTYTRNAFDLTWERLPDDADGNNRWRKLE